MGSCPVLHLKRWSRIPLLSHFPSPMWGYPGTVVSIIWVAYRCSWDLTCQVTVPNGSTVIFRMWVNIHLGIHTTVIDFDNGSVTPWSLRFPLILNPMPNLYQCTIGIPLAVVCFCFWVVRTPFLCFSRHSKLYNVRCCCCFAGYVCFVLFCLPSTVRTLEMICGGPINRCMPVKQNGIATGCDKHHFLQHLQP